MTEYHQRYAHNLDGTHLSPRGMQRSDGAAGVREAVTSPFAPGKLEPRDAHGHMPRMKTDRSTPWNPRCHRYTATLEPNPLVPGLQDVRDMTPDRRHLDHNRYYLDKIPGTNMVPGRGHCSPRGHLSPAREMPDLVHKDNNYNPRHTRGFGAGSPNPLVPELQNLCDNTPSRETMAIMRYHHREDGMMHSPRKSTSEAANTAATPSTKGLYATGASPRNYGLSSPYAHDEELGAGNSRSELQRQSVRRMTSSPITGTEGGGLFSEQMQAAVARRSLTPQASRSGSAPRLGVRSEAIVESVLSLKQAAGVKSEVLSSSALRYHQEFENDPSRYNSSTPPVASAMDWQNPIGRDDIKRRSSSVGRLFLDGIGNDPMTPRNAKMGRLEPPPLDGIFGNAPTTPRNAKISSCEPEENTQRQLDALLSARGEPRPWKRPVGTCTSPSPREDRRGTGCHITPERNAVPVFKHPKERQKLFKEPMKPEPGPLTTAFNSLNTPRKVGDSAPSKPAAVKTDIVEEAHREPSPESRPIGGPPASDTSMDSYLVPESKGLGHGGLRFVTDACGRMLCTSNNGTARARSMSPVRMHEGNGDIIGWKGAPTEPTPHTGKVMAPVPRTSVVGAPVATTATSCNSVQTRHNMRFAAKGEASSCGRKTVGEKEFVGDRPKGYMDALYRKHADMIHQRARLRVTPDTNPRRMWALTKEHMMRQAQKIPASKGNTCKRT